MSAPRIAAAASLLVVACAAPVSHAYTGGPIRAEIAGFEPSEHKVFYRLLFYDQTGTPPQVYYFDLDAPDPEKAVRAPSLEQSQGEQGSEAWGAVRKRLVPLRGLPDFEMKLKVRADSVGIDTTWHVPEYRLNASVETASRERTVELEAFCEPLCRVRGVYGVPGRTERLVVLSYTGRTYGCEEIDLPVLLPPKAGWPKADLGAAPGADEIGAIAGIVTDARGRPVLYANLYVDGVKNGAYSAPDGTYALTGVPAGPRTVRVRLMGYAPNSSVGVRVEGRQTTRVDFKLTEKPVHLTY